MVHKKHVILAISLAGLLFNAANSFSAQLPSFPDAEGFGAIAAGGRGGKRIKVMIVDGASDIIIRNIKLRVGRT